MNHKNELLNNCVKTRWNEDYQCIIIESCAKIGVAVLTISELLHLEKKSFLGQIYIAFFLTYHFEMDLVGYKMHCSFAFCHLHFVRCISIGFCWEGRSHLLSVNFRFIAYYRARKVEMKNLLFLASVVTLGYSSVVPRK